MSLARCRADHWMMDEVVIMEETKTAGEVACYAYWFSLAERRRGDEMRDRWLQSESNLGKMREQLYEARHAKAQMELRWQAAEKECAELRAKLECKS